MERVLTHSGAQYRALRTKSGANTHTQRRHTALGRGEERRPTGRAGLVGGWQE